MADPHREVDDEEGEDPENLKVSCTSCRTIYTTSPEDFHAQRNRCPVCKSFKAGAL